MLLCIVSLALNDLFANVVLFVKDLFPLYSKSTCFIFTFGISGAGCSNDTHIPILLLVSSIPIVSFVLIKSPLY
jgi:hypothetical protein